MTTIKKTLSNRGARAIVSLILGLTVNGIAHAEPATIVARKPLTVDGEVVGAVGVSDTASARGVAPTP